MDWERIRRKLEPIVNTRITLSRLPLIEWDKLSASQSSIQQIGKGVWLDRLYFLLEVREGVAVFFVLESVSLTSSEQQLIELVLDTYIFSDKIRASSTLSEEEKTVQLVKEWVDRQQSLKIKEAVLPEQLVSKLALASLQIPLLLYGEYSDSQLVSYKELKKLLKSFFDAEIVLIPLMDKEWLILASESLLTASEGEDKESVEDALASICSGLYEMLANEWLGECQLTIHYPMETPAKSLLQVIVEMRETMRLGKMCYPSASMHLPWQMRLEKLLNALTETEQKRYVSQVLKRNIQSPDTEMYVLLERFFALDCNVSETAKSLYVHRNTLLYRLDKFKQETGLDVRNFNDAVLVQVALLLYKVTKRR
ncbi:MAG: helix-turn-helix domain-containing protein [Paenibacillaceae bacterium]